MYEFLIWIRTCIFVCLQSFDGYSNFRLYIDLNLIRSHVIIGSTNPKREVIQTVREECQCRVCMYCGIQDLFPSFFLFIITLYGIYIILKWTLIINLNRFKNEHVTLLYKQAAVCDRRIHLFIQEDLLIGACFIYNSTIPSNHLFF